MVHQNHDCRFSVSSWSKPWRVWGMPFLSRLYAIYVGKRTILLCYSCRNNTNYLQVDRNPFQAPIRCCSWPIERSGKYTEFKTYFTKVHWSVSWQSIILDALWRRIPGCVMVSVPVDGSGGQGVQWKRSWHQPKGIHASGKRFQDTYRHEKYNSTSKSLVHLGAPNRRSW